MTASNSEAQSRLRMSPSWNSAEGYRARASWSKRSLLSMPTTSHPSALNRPAMRPTPQGHIEHAHAGPQPKKTGDHLCVAVGALVAQHLPIEVEVVLVEHFSRHAHTTTSRRSRPRASARPSDSHGGAWPVRSLPARSTGCRSCRRQGSRSPGQRVRAGHPCRRPSATDRGRR
jgi:hypothetical protein